MKKAPIALLLLVCILASFASCTGTTPDVAATQNEMTLDSLNWSIAVEGGSATTYTMADAQKHTLSKGTASMFMWVDPGGNGTGSLFKSFIAEGITVAQFLADMGKPDATSVTYYGTDVLNNAEISYTLTEEQIQSDKVLIAWIYNKKSPLPSHDTKTFVGLVDGTGNFKDFKNCLSIDKLVIG